MAPDQECDGSDRARSANTRIATAPTTTSTANVRGGSVAVVVTSYPSSAVLQSASAMVVPTSSPQPSLAASTSAVSAFSGRASSDDSDVVMDRVNERPWKRSVSTETREKLVDGMLEELRRITGQENVRHLRMCASRYESLVWKKSNNEIEYTQKIQRRIQSLRRQPSQHEIKITAAAAAAQHLAVAPSASNGDGSVATIAAPSLPTTHGTRSSSGRRLKHRRSSPSSLSHHRSSRSSSLSATELDAQYFSRLHIMRASYRDEVALVFRELCRVNTVIQHSASLRRHESNNLGDFLANLKKIIYLLEQQPDEMHGMIPSRKRTLEYLDVVESHIQRKVLPILYRLRHTYSTILRPLVLNYLRNCTRVSRRL